MQFPSIIEFKYFSIINYFIANKPLSLIELIIRIVPTLQTGR